MWSPDFKPNEFGLWFEYFLPKKLRQEVEFIYWWVPNPPPGVVNALSVSIYVYLLQAKGRQPLLEFKKLNLPIPCSLSLLKKIP